MANLAVKDGAAADKYLKTSGVGTDVDPHVPEHLETNSAAILAAVDGVEALLTTVDADTSTLAGAVSGTEMQVDVVSSALPTGAATSAKQDTQTTHLATVAGAVSGTEMQVDVLTSALPTGAATAANQATEITHLATLAGAVGGTEMQADIVSSALPTGASTAANQTTLIGHVDGIEALLTTIDADTSTLAAAVSTEMQVDVVGALPAGDNNIGNVDVASIAAGENLIGLVGASDIVVTITPTLDTNAYTSGDLLFDSTEIANAVRVNGGTCIVQSITIIDKDDQLKAMKLIFADAATDFGTVNSAPDPDDTEVATVVGHYEVSIDDSANNIDLGGASVHCHRNVGLVLKAGAATTSLWVAGMTMGAPTHTASGLVIKLGILRS